MSERDSRAVTNMREGIEAEGFAEGQARLRKNERAARAMAVLMANEEPFTVEDFIFVASLGKPEDYATEAATLEVAQQLRPGQLAGVMREKRLRQVGVVGEPVLSMSVTTGMRGQLDPDQEMLNRRLGASLHMVISARRASEDSRHPFLEVELHREAQPVNILYGSGEPSYGRKAFYHPGSLVVGAEAILGHVSSVEDEIGIKQLATLLDALSQSTTSEPAVS